MQLILCLLLGVLIFGGLVVLKMVSAVLDPAAFFNEIAELPGWMILLCIGMAWAGFTGGLKGE